jgi:hypothetical protein
MKLPSVRRYRHLILAGMTIVALSCGTTSLRVFAAPSTNAPAANAPAAPAPEIDKETGKPVVTTPSGLKYVDLVVGKGPAVKTGDHVLVNYLGKLIDGTMAVPSIMCRA